MLFHLPRCHRLRTWPGDEFKLKTHTGLCAGTDDPYLYEILKESFTDTKTVTNVAASIRVL